MIHIEWGRAATCRQRRVISSHGARLEIGFMALSVKSVSAHYVFSGCTLCFAAETGMCWKHPDWLPAELASEGAFLPFESRRSELARTREAFSAAPAARRPGVLVHRHQSPHLANANMIYPHFIVAQAQCKVNCKHSGTVVGKLWPVLRCSLLNFLNLNLKTE